MRQLLPSRFRGKGHTVITGDKRMQERPCGPLVDALRANGCKIDYLNREGCLPLVCSPTHHHYIPLPCRLIGPRALVWRGGGGSCVRAEVWTSFFCFCGVPPAPSRRSNFDVSFNFVIRPFHTCLSFGGASFASVCAIARELDWFGLTRPPFEGAAEPNASGWRVQNSKNQAQCLITVDDRWITFRDPPFPGPGPCTPHGRSGEHCEPHAAGLGCM